MAKAHNNSTSAKDSLFQKLNKQRKEIERLLEKGLAQSAKMKKHATDQNLINIVIRRERIENEVIGMPRRIKATPKEVFPALSAACLAGAAAASMKANTALTQGRIEDCCDLLNSAERLLGAAVAMSFVNEVNSAIAGVKGKISHATRTYAKKKRALDFWRKHIDPKISANKAAEMINERYLSTTGEEISFATLSEWVSAEKKKSTQSF